MTINLGYFSPPFGTTNTSTSYILSSSASSSSTINVYSTYNNSRAKCRTLPVTQSDILPGERGTALKGAGSSAPLLVHSKHQDTTAMTLDQLSPSSQKTAAWPECFQDLRSWCPRDRDELNTPQLSMQDEFNFSPDGQVNNDCIWGFVESSPLEGNGPLVNRDLFIDNAVLNADEENNNYSFNESFSPYEVDMSENNKVIEYNNIPDVTQGKGVILKNKEKDDAFLSQEVDNEVRPRTLGLGGGKLFNHIKLDSSQTATRLLNGGEVILKKDKVTNDNHMPGKELPALTVQQQCPQKESLVGLQNGKPQVPSTNKRSKLKLDVSLSTPPPSEASNPIATPDVLGSLNDLSSNGFNLVQYVIEGAEVAKPEIVMKDLLSLHDNTYETEAKEKIYIKGEPLSPGMEYATTSRKRRRSQQDDDDYDSDRIQDGGSESDEWYPGKEQERGQARGGAPVRRGRKPSSVESISSDVGPDRYRALRDRNNEASRRSRQNRKQRDLEMKHHKAELERKNSALKVRADKMQKLVEEMRAALLKSITNSRMHSLKA